MHAQDYSDQLKSNLKPKFCMNFVLKTRNFPFVILPDPDKQNNAHCILGIIWMTWPTEQIPPRAARSHTTWGGGRAGGALRSPRSRRKRRSSSELPTSDIDNIRVTLCLNQNSFKLTAAHRGLAQNSDLWSNYTFKYLFTYLSMYSYFIRLVLTTKNVVILCK